MSAGIVIRDRNGHSIFIDDHVRVNVGHAGSTPRPGVVIGLTKKNVLVRFSWANGRTTDRRFPVRSGAGANIVDNGLIFDVDNVVWDRTLNDYEVGGPDDPDATIVGEILDGKVSIDDDAIKAVAADAWARHPNNPDAPINLRRKAVVNSTATSLEQIQRYLPANYEASVQEDASGHAWIIIEGQDRLGWTLQDYVIPRLASGLIFAEEVTAS